MKTSVTILLLIALVGGAYWFGGENARAELEAVRKKEQARLVQLADQLSRKAAELEAEREARAGLVKELEDAAMADPDGSRSGISDGGMQRLQQRWSRD